MSIHHSTGWVDAKHYKKPTVKSAGDEAVVSINVKVLRVRLSHVTIWTQVGLYDLYNELDEKTVPSVAYVYTAKIKKVFL